jgi:hypothetical protein
MFSVRENIPDTVSSGVSGKDGGSGNVGGDDDPVKIGDNTMNLGDEALEVKENFDFGAIWTWIANGPHVERLMNVQLTYGVRVVKSGGDVLCLGSTPETGRLLEEGLGDMPEHGGEELSVVSHRAGGRVDSP